MPSCKGPKAQASPSVDHHPPDDSKKVCSGQRILLVEDNVINQKVTMRMLSDLGCNVTVNDLILLHLNNISLLSHLLTTLSFPVGTKWTRMPSYSSKQRGIL